MSPKKGRKNGVKGGEKMKKNAKQHQGKYSQKELQVMGFVPNQEWCGALQD